MNRPSHWLQYLGLRSVGGLVSSFGSAANLETAASVGSAYFRLSQRHRRRAMLNIAAAFPELDEDRVRDLAEASVRSLMSMFLLDSLVMTRKITPTGWASHVRLGDLGDTIETLLSDRPCLLVTAHLGNFELLGYTLSMLGLPITALARPLDNPMLNEWILRMRTRHGLEIITKFGATERVVDAVARGGKVAFIADQNAGEDGIFVPFFDRLASSYKSIALLAVRERLPIVAGFACRIADDFDYEIRCLDRLDPEAWADHPDPIFYVSAWYTHAIERMVRSAPEQYWWLHRRWRSRPRFEREGRPMPARLIGKLESLPWMTPESLERIRRHTEDRSADPAPGTAR
ncbi:MAG: lysophospholipid acyltransferase family protein [Planctomycetota bacterium]